MKTILSILTIVLFSILFTGCGVTQVHFDKTYTSKHINPHLFKVESTPVSINTSSSEILRKPKSLRGRVGIGSITLNTHVGEINKEISQQFFRQYFNDVSLSKEISSKGIHIVSNVKDYQFEYQIDDTVMSVKVHIIAYVDGVEKINKTYETPYETNKAIVTLKSSLKYGSIEYFHKLLLKVYETQLKPDLLKVL